jgi:hypothetical protein
LDWGILWFSSVTLPTNQNILKDRIFWNVRPCRLSTWYCVTEYLNLHEHRFENLKSHTLWACLHYRILFFFFFTFCMYCVKNFTLFLFFSSACLLVT